MQHQLWAHQHPVSCKNKRVVYVSLKPSGLGSQLHVLGMILALAINYDVILALFPDHDSKWVNRNFCRGQTSLECYLEPITSCGVPYELLKTWRLKGLSQTSYYAVIQRWEDINLYPNIQYFYLDRSSYVLTAESMFEVPWFQHNVLPGDSYSLSEQRAYWRAQSVTYLLRPNNRTLEWMNAYRRTNCPSCRDSYDASLHIRQGDKYLEMTIVNEKSYAEVLETLQPILGGVRSVYINADSSDSVQHLEQQFAGKLSVSSLFMTRLNVGFDSLSSREDVPLISLTDLREQVKSRLFLGTYSSNWNRLIFELGSTLGFGPSVPFIEIGDTSCLSAIQCRDRSLEFDCLW